MPGRPKTAVEEMALPGIGVRYDFVAASDECVGVVVHRDVRREIVVYDRPDDDACRRAVRLEPEDARTLAELLGASGLKAPRQGAGRDGRRGSPLPRARGAQWSSSPSPRGSRRASGCRRFPSTSSAGSRSARSRGRR